MDGRTNALSKSAPSIRFWYGGGSGVILYSSTSGKSSSMIMDPTFDLTKGEYIAYWGNINESTTNQWYYKNSSDSTNVILRTSAASGSALIKLTPDTVSKMTIIGKPYVYFDGNKTHTSLDIFSGFSTSKLTDTPSSKSNYLGYYEMEYFLGRLSGPIYLEVFADGTTEIGNMVEPGRYKLSWFFAARSVVISSGSTFSQGLIVGDDFEDLIVDVDSDNNITYVSGPDKVPCYLGGNIIINNELSDARYLASLFGVYDWQRV